MSLGQTHRHTHIACKSNFKKPVACFGPAPGLKISPDWVNSFGTTFDLENFISKKILFDN